MAQSTIEKQIETAKLIAKKQKSKVAALQEKLKEKRKKSFIAFLKKNKIDEVTFYNFVEANIDHIKENYVIFDKAAKGKDSSNVLKSTPKKTTRKKTVKKVADPDPRA